MKAEIRLPQYVFPGTQPLLGLCNPGGWKISHGAGEEAGAWHLLSDVFKTQGSVIVSINHYYRFIFLDPLPVLLDETQAGHCHRSGLKREKWWRFRELPKTMAVAVLIPGSGQHGSCTSLERRGEEGRGPSPPCPRAHACLQNCPNSPGFVMEMWTLKEESIMSNYKLYYRVLSNCLLTVVVHMWFVGRWCNHFGKFPPAGISRGELLSQLLWGFALCN